MPQQLHSKRTATPAKAGKLLFPQARDVDMFYDGWQAAIFFWGGAQQPAHSSSSQRASAWHVCMDCTTPSERARSPHRQQPLGKDAYTHTLSFVLMHMHMLAVDQHQLTRHTHAHAPIQLPFTCKPPLSPELLLVGRACVSSQLCS